MAAETENRRRQLEEATEAAAAARSAMETAPTAKARREAAEDYEFHTSRKAYLAGWLASEEAA